MPIDNTQYSIKKSLSQVYKFRRPQASYWADITLDDNGTCGRIQIASDFGAWQYYWGACGCPLKEFLIGLNYHYVAGKFKVEEDFFEDETILRYKKDLLAERRNEGISQQDARLVYDEIQSLYQILTAIGFEHHIVDHCPNLYEFYDYIPPMVMKKQRLFEMFWNSVWQVFVAELKNELQNAAQ